MPELHNSAHKRSLSGPNSMRDLQAFKFRNIEIKLSFDDIDCIGLCHTLALRIAFDRLHTCQNTRDRVMCSFVLETQLGRGRSPLGVVFCNISCTSNDFPSENKVLYFVFESFRSF